MSFSSKVKEELSKDCNNPRHCCIAETAAIISMCGKVIFDEKDRVRIEIHTENVTVARTNKERIPVTSRFPMYFATVCSPH